MKVRIKPEILSPAGDMHKLRFAIRYGADAVYLAGNIFGMRTASENFSREELKQAVQLAHGQDVKVYVTVNTMPRNSEMNLLPNYLAYLQDISVDALIISDLGVLRLAQKYAPHVPIHVSTQASITNYESARMWYELGAERVVLARELSLEEIAEIREKTPPSLSIEAFVHGAMCMSFSGRCLLSSFMTGRDANRGNCAQPCRWNYRLVEEKRPGEYMPVYEDEQGSYILNAKDLCMIEHIPALIGAGIESFKIEGRVKTEYYTAIITNAYRRAVDLYMKDPDHFELPGEIKDEVNKVSYRAYCTGFYFGHPQKGQYYEDSQYRHEWDVIAVVESCENNLAACIQKNKFSIGDTLEAIEPGKPAFSFVVKELYDDKGQPIDAAPHPMQRVWVRLPQNVAPMAFLRRENKMDEKTTNI